MTYYFVTCVYFLKRIQRSFELNALKMKLLNASEWSSEMNILSYSDDLQFSLSNFLRASNCLSRSSLCLPPSLSLSLSDISLFCSLIFLSIYLSLPLHLSPLIYILTIYTYIHYNPHPYLVSRRDERVDRANVDDATVSVFAHVRKHSPRGLRRAHQHDIHQLLPLFRWKVLSQGRYRHIWGREGMSEYTCE